MGTALAGHESSLKTSLKYLFVFEGKTLPPLCPAAAGGHWDRGNTDEAVRYLWMFKVVGEKQSRSRTSTAPARAESLIAIIATTSCHVTIPHGFYKIVETFVNQDHREA